MHLSSKIYIAGHRGLVGSALVRRLRSEGYDNLLLRTSRELDLTDQRAVADFFAAEKPEYVFLAAARVGGILANATYPADFIHTNLQIQDNVIHHSFLNGVKRLLFLGSSCIYPREAPQPMREEHLMTGPLEATNSAYAVAKIAGIEMCWAYNRQHNTEYIPVMPTNLYGPGDSFDLCTSHVLPALMRKFHLAKLAQHGDLAAVARDEQRFGPIPDDVLEGLGIERSSKLEAGSSKQEESSSKFEVRSLKQEKESRQGEETYISRSSSLASSFQLQASSSPKVVLWGTGAPRREFLHVDDLADACCFLMTQPRDTIFSRPAPVSPLTPHASPSSSSQPLFNIGTGKDAAIMDIASLVAEVVGYRGQVVWDHTRPDGTPRKLLDVSRLTALGWKASIPLHQGIAETYEWYTRESEQPT